MTDLFISDLHLDAAYPQITEQFLAFLSSRVAPNDRLFILGDLFEAWIGDDDPEPSKRRIVAALKAATSAGSACFVMHGNRDFLLGQRFCDETGAQLIADGTVVDLHGQRVLLMHGDLLCTDDHSYQRLRRIVRNPLVRFTLRHLTLQQRQRLAQRMREGSKAHISSMDRVAPTIMDVNPQAVVDTMTRHGVKILVHGHTHRPAVHSVDLGAARGTRIVLGDWYEQGSLLRWDERGFELITLARAAI